MPFCVCVCQSWDAVRGEDRLGCLRPSHCIDSLESLRSHAFDYLTALSFLSYLLFFFFLRLLLPTAPDQTHSDRGRDPEAQKQGKRLKLSVRGAGCGCRCGRSLSGVQTICKWMCGVVSGQQEGSVQGWWEGLRNGFSFLERGSRLFCSGY